MTAAERSDRIRPRTRTPLALLAALTLLLGLGLAIERAQLQLADTRTLMFEWKRAWATGGPAADVLIFGDSGSVAALEPRVLLGLLPEGARIHNLALPGSGPSGAEILLREYLGHHAPPRLVVLSYAPYVMLELRTVFYGRVLPNLMDGREAVTVALRDREPRHLVEWAMTRLPVYRHRADLPSALQGALYEALPALRERLAPLLVFGAHDPSHPERFDFYYGDRKRRNTRFLADLEENAGFYDWPEFALPGGLPADAYFERVPFEPARRELVALEAVADLCATLGIRILVLPPALPLNLVAGMIRAGDLEGFTALWQALAERYPRWLAFDDSVAALRHEFFSDQFHLNAIGRRHYERMIAKRLSQAWHATAHGAATSEAPR